MKDDLKNIEIIMLNDNTYVGEILSKYLKKLGFTVRSLSLSGKIKTFIKLTRAHRALIHAHYAKAPAIYAYLSKKPYVVHCHGKDVRYEVKGWLLKRSLKKAGWIFVSTSDLLQYVREYRNKVSYLPKPVDTDLFYPRREVSEVKTAIYFMKEAWDPGLKKEEDKAFLKLVKECRRLGVRLTIRPIFSTSRKEMPELLSSHDLLLDRWSIQSYSLTALEAMALGIPVIGHETPLEEIGVRLEDAIREPKELVKKGLKIVEEHKPDRVLKKLLDVYGKVLAGVSQGAR